MNPRCNTQTRCKASSSLPGSLPDADTALLSQAGAGAGTRPFHPFSYKPSGISGEKHLAPLCEPGHGQTVKSEWWPCRGNGVREAEAMLPQTFFAMGVPDHTWQTSSPTSQAQRKPVTVSNCKNVANITQKPSPHCQILFQCYRNFTLPPKTDESHLHPVFQVVEC